MDFVSEFSRCDEREGNTLLFDWICHKREELFDQLSSESPVLRFWSYNAGNPDHPDTSRKSDSFADKYAYLLTDPSDVRKALAEWSMLPHRYSGDFILSLDNAGLHASRRRTLVEKLQDSTIELKMDTAIELAWRDTWKGFGKEDSVTRLDVLEFARSATLYFAAGYFGLPAGKVLANDGLANWSTVAFNEYIWKIHARHFIAERPDSRKAIDNIQNLIISSFGTAPENSVLGRFRADPGAFVDDRSQADFKAIVANILGCIQGMIDNITNSACLGIQQMASLPKRSDAPFSESDLRAIIMTKDAFNDQSLKALQHYLFVTHQFDTPAPFLPRYANSNLGIKWKGTDLQYVHVACAIGPAVRQINAETSEKYLLDCRMGFGMHECVGKYVGDQLATRIVRKILSAGDISSPEMDKQWGWIVKHCSVEITFRSSTQHALAKQSSGHTPPFILTVSADNSPSAPSLDHVLKIPSADIPYLTLNELNGFSPEVFSLMSSKQLGAISASQISGLGFLHCMALKRQVQRNSVQWNAGQQSALERRMSYFAVVRVTHDITPRPHAYSLWSADPDTKAVHDYVTWPGLVDRQYTARHLPPASEDYVKALPHDAPYNSSETHGKLTALFKYEKDLTETSRSSLLFPVFAQWFTDSFLRTDRLDRRKNTSNHQVDMCQIYGLNETVSRQLRYGSGGLLASEQINGNEFPPRLFDSNGNVRTLYRQLPYVVNGHVDELLNRWDEVTVRQQSYLVSGLASGNATLGNAAMNTLFLREHNRLCRELQKRNSDWKDERLFQTARLIVILVELKIVISEYINHISAPPDSEFEKRRIFEFDTSYAENERWYRQNHIALEFNLLYRWHSLIPGTIQVGNSSLSLQHYIHYNAPLLDQGLDAILISASRQQINSAGLFSTQDELLRAEYQALKMSRDFRVRSFNDYRQHFNLRRLTSFDELGCHDTVARRLHELYNGDIESLDWLIGLYAEKSTQGAVFGDLMTSMVAYDAFTQVLTNPLLSRNVLSSKTITPLGMETLEQTSSLDDLWKRNRDANSDYSSTAFTLSMDAMSAL